MLYLSKKQKSRKTKTHKRHMYVQQVILTQHIYKKGIPLMHELSKKKET